jgi:hypothetical protein
MPAYWCDTRGVLRAAALAALAVVACGDDASPHAVWIGGSPDLVVYRQGAGVWQPAIFQQVDEEGYSEYWLPVVGDYSVVVACTEYGGTVLLGAEVLATTDDDDATIFDNGGYWCGEATTEPVVKLTGQVDQPGRLWAQYVAASGNSTPWGYSLSVTPGSGSLVAVDENYTTMALRNNVAFRQDALEQAIDLSSEAYPMTRMDLAVTGLQPGWLDGWSANINAPNTWFTLVQALSTEESFSSLDLDGMLVAPAELLHNVDPFDEFIGITSSSSFYDAPTDGSGCNEAMCNSTVLQDDVTVDLFDSDIPTTLAVDVPPPLGSASLAIEPGFVASWSELPLGAADTTTFWLGGCQAGGSSLYQTIQVTGRWLATHPSNQVTFSSDADGYDPSWQVALDGQYTYSMDVEYDDTISGSVIVERDSSVYQTITSPVSACSTVARTIPVHRSRVAHRTRHKNYAFQSRRG